MYKISEFSRITNLTIKALRYYDELNILKPSYRAENLYRFYDDSDFQKAGIIVLLRDLNFSIQEIKEVIVSCGNPGDLNYFLKEKQDMIRAQIKKQKELINKINLCLEPQKKEAIAMNYNIVIKELEPVTVLAIRYKGKYNDVGKYISTIYKEANGKIDGDPFCCYYDDEYKEDADIELCVPTKGLLNGVKTTAKRLPRIKAVCTTHIGSYETINLAYKALMDYTKENNIEGILPSREIYRKGPGMIFNGNPNKYETELVMPFEEVL